MPRLSDAELNTMFHGNVPWAEVNAIFSDASEDRTASDVLADLNALAASKKLVPKSIPRSWVPEALIEFEQDIADKFNRGEIKAPIHLAGGNEQQLIDIFKEVRPQDWVCCSWRSHFHCLLKGVPPQELKDAIVAGRSIGLCFPAQRVISSALVGGIVPIAMGLAWAAKHREEDEKVFCFIGDMTVQCGLVHECAKYANGHKLPLEVVVEDNGLSVATDTEASWGDTVGLPLFVRWYKYTLTWPHVGSGQWVHM